MSRWSKHKTNTMFNGNHLGNQWGAIPAIGIFSFCYTTLHAPYMRWFCLIFAANNAYTRQNVIWTISVEILFCNWLKLFSFHWHSPEPITPWCHYFTQCRLINCIHTRQFKCMNNLCVIYIYQYPHRFVIK